MKLKTKKELIILAVIIAFIAGLSVFISSIKTEDNTETTTTTTTTKTSSETTAAETTTAKETTTAFEHAGDKSNSIYSNEWIGIKMNIPKGYTDAAANMPTDGDSIMAYDIALENTDGSKDVRAFTLHFSNCDDEQDWLDYIEYHKDGTELMESLNLKEIEGIKATDRIIIAGEEYLSVKGEDKDNGEIYFFCYRKIENRVVAIMIAGKTVETNENFISQIEKI